MNDYFQYVHNLKGVAQYEKLKPAARDAVVSTFLRQFENYNTLEKTILKAIGKEVLQYISAHLDLKKYCKNIILTTGSSSHIDEVDFNHVKAIINLRRINVIRHPNELFRAVNTLLPDNGIYIGRLETYGQRKNLLYRLVRQKQIGRMLWMMDFFLNRVIPRIPYLEDIYYYVTKGQLHAISIAEALGRLVYCGFEIVDTTEINGLSYIVAKKIGAPSNHRHPSYYPIIKLNRVGKHGEMIGVYKLRTLHPYSEFLQEYVIRLNGYDDKGKPADDFRVTRWGKILRMMWIDELPQLYQVLRGEMKLVGLRPLSPVRFNEFPDDLKDERIKYKPGCFPPYVALCMPDDKGNIEAERIYLRAYSNLPHFTDIRYFVKAVYNIVTNKIRSS
jgi:lipopolysaccharide/colanic/teichoic acid biosynthesis glycosyltransferase